MTESQVIVFAIPVFFALIGIELLVGIARNKNTYRLYDAMSSISAGMLSQLVNVSVKALGFAAYAMAYPYLALSPLSADALWVWVAAIVLYDLAYYWNHRAGHRITLFWAAHAVHHQSEDYNLSTALRQTSTGWMFGWIFYLPLAVLGFPPEVVGVAGLINLLYQYWVHTEHVGKLGWFDRVFCSPSNHRVHHAVNDAYLDKNYGGILILWDRLFGTFQEEDENDPCRYGTRSHLHNWSPLVANLQVYRERFAEMRATQGVGNKLALWWKGPEWHAQSRPASQFDIDFIKYEPEATGPQQALATAIFVLCLIAVTALLWYAEQLGAVVVLVATLTLGLLMHVFTRWHKYPSTNSITIEDHS